MNPVAGPAVDVNVFEGCRRIALALKLAWLVLVALVGAILPTSVSMNFVTQGPGSPFVRTDEPCASGDARKFVTRTLENGTSVLASLCFKSRAPYTRQVEAYTDARARLFRLTPADHNAARSAWSAKRQSQIGYATLAAVAGWFVLSALQTLIGWIARGFAGIPLGHDRRA
jgi:hypothetical protein